MEAERALDTAVREEVRDTRLRVSLDLDALLRAVDNGWFNGDDEETA